MTKVEVAPPPPAANHPTRLRRLSPALAMVGLVAMSFLFGAAVMFFQLPGSGFLGKAFLGARAWEERRQMASDVSDPGPPPAARGLVDRPARTFDGFTLFACAKENAWNTQAFLMDMRRQVVHRWAIPFSRIWPDPPHIRVRVRDSLVCFFGCHLYPNGDLLVVLHGLERRTVGYGLVKLDKDSNVLWKYAANVHHDVDVGEDGTVYAIEQELVDRVPKGLEFIPTPCLVDSLVLLSPAGEVLKKVPILEAFRDSPYSALLSSLERPGKREGPPAGLTAPGLDEDALRGDPLHTNFVHVLTRKLAPRFPRFKAGQVLVSVRNLDAVAVIDVDSGKVVWAARGPWRAQHDAQFLANGRLLIFDNRGLPGRSRALEYDPQTQAFPWSYAGENWHPFYTSERGMSQRLPNGNTLVVNSEGGEVLEVTRGKEVVWSCLMDRFLTTARRYPPDRLHFLKGGQRARP